MSTVLEIADIRKTFGGLKAVDGLGLTIKAGEVVGLLGPNGSGKTTLMNLISGALKPTEGSIRLEGQEIAGRRPDAIARAGVAAPSSSCGFCLRSPCWTMSRFRPCSGRSGCPAQRRRRSRAPVCKE